MCREHLKTLVAVVVSTLLLIGCAEKNPGQDQYSGYLEDYSQIKKTKDAKGDPVLRFVSPRLNPENYQKIIIEPVQYYPEPEATEYVSSQTLGEIKSYIDQMFRRKIGEKVSVVDQPGPGVIRMRVALTAVGKKTENLKAYQFIPVALALTGAQAMTTGRPQEAALYLEAEMTDSISGERLGIAVRKGTGERLRKSREGGRQLTVGSLKPLLDRWAEAYADFVFENFSSK